MENKHKWWHSDGTHSDYRDYSKELHREDGPAIEWANGDKYWYTYGKLHRLDGPAIEYANGCKEWWINDEQINEKEFEKHPLRIKYLVDLEIMRLLDV
jgi:hypothetical protein